MLNETSNGADHNPTPARRFASQLTASMRLMQSWLSGLLTGRRHNRPIVLTRRVEDRPIAVGVRRRLP